VYAHDQLRPRRRPLRRLALLCCLTVVGLAGLAEAERWSPVAGGHAGPGTAVLPVLHEGPPPERLAPLPDPVGGADGYAFAHTQPYDSSRPVAFDPCRPVQWTVRRDGEIPGGDALLEDAVAEIGRLTGLVFERVADTDEGPVRDRATVQHERYGPGAAPVLVVWSNEDEWPVLSGLVAGVAGGHWLDVGRPDSRRYVNGQLVLDGPQLAETLDASANGPARVSAVLMHELAHVVGLDHVIDADQLMHPLHLDLKRFGEGDRRGLRALGDGECFTDWPLVVGTD
jgi:hypothetical protein